MKLRTTDWVDIDIAEEMLFPAGAMYERRIVNNQIQVQNPGFVDLYDPKYIDLVMSIGAVR